MTVLRRAVTVPLVTVLMVCVSGPLLFAVTAVAGLAKRSSRPTRTVALIMAYAVIELRSLGKLMRDGPDCDRLMRLSRYGYTAVRRILDVEVVLDSASTTPEEIPRDQPIIVLSRHCGPGDSVLVAWLLTFEYRLRVRIVLKAVLRCEPVLDLAGDDHQLHSAGRVHAASRASRRSHTLPPRTGGATAALAGAPSANVLVLTHNGFSPDGRARPWWQLPVHRQLLVRTVLVPAAQLPQPDQLSPWLEQTWTQVDAWVASHTDHS